MAGDGPPLLTRRPAVRDLSGYPWIDYDAPAFTAPAAVSPGDSEASLDPVLERLFRETGRRVTTRLHAGAAALLPMAAGPGSPGCRRSCSTGWLSPSPGRCPPASAGSATGRASLPGARPRTWRRSRRWRKPCPRPPWSAAADPRPERRVSALTCRFGTAWVPRRMQTRVYRRRRLHGQGDLPAPAQDCRVAVVRAPPRAVTRRKNGVRTRRLRHFRPDLPRANGRTPLARPHCQLEPIAFRTGQPIDEIRIPFDYNFIRQQILLRVYNILVLFSV